jgi:uncharacterized protein
MKKVRCPICDKPMDGQGPKEWPEWPFCSRRCQLIDLGRWLGGSYRIETPARAEDLDDADANADATDSPPKSAGSFGRSQ